MNPGDLEAIRQTIESVTARAMEAERRAARAEAERDQLRAILSRVRTSLAETTSLVEVA